MDMMDEKVKGTFAAYELQKIIKDANKLWKIERVIRSRKRAKQEEHFVKWKGFPEKFNSWVSEKNITKL